jgi:hypothetical protein
MHEPWPNQLTIVFMKAVDLGADSRMPAYTGIDDG